MRVGGRTFLLRKAGEKAKFVMHLRAEGGADDGHFNRSFYSRPLQSVFQGTTGCLLNINESMLHTMIQGFPISRGSKSQMLQSQ